MIWSRCCPCPKTPPNPTTLLDAVSLQAHVPRTGPGIQPEAVLLHSGLLLSGLSKIRFFSRPLADTRPRAHLPGHETMTTRRKNQLRATACAITGSFAGVAYGWHSAPATASIVRDITTVGGAGIGAFLGLIVYLVLFDH